MHVGDHKLFQCIYQVAMAYLVKTDTPADPLRADHLAPIYPNSGNMRR